MSWKKPFVNDDGPGNSTSATLQHWKRPLTNSSADSAASLGPDWKKPCLSEVSNERSTANKSFVEHEVSIDPLTLQFCQSASDKTGPKTAQSFDISSLCHCQQNCCKLFTSAQIRELRSLWHSMADDAQSQYLQAQWKNSASFPASSSADELSHRTQWSVCSQRVCFKGVALILGTSAKTLTKRLKGMLDMRKAHGACKVPTRLPVKKNMVDLFFAELYHSTAESLPEHYHMKNLDDEDPQMDFQTLNNEFQTFAWTPEASFLDTVTSTAALDMASTPVKHLPPGSPIHLFLQFQAWWCATSSVPGGADQKPPSWSTFFRVWQSWTAVLKFRKVSQHKDCDSCFDFREKLAFLTGASQGEKLTIARDWQEHLRAQCCDRLIYWSMRLASKQGSSSGVITLICDSMDKVKTSFPQWNFAGSKIPAHVQGLKRPRLVLTGVIVHGWVTCLYYCNEEQPHGASAFCEMVCRALGEVQRIARRNGKPVPRHLYIQSDNTTAQTKNSVAHKLGVYLTSSGYFLTTTYAYLVAGHTKEDIDRLFSVVLNKVLRRHKFATPQEFGEQLVKEMGPVVHSKQEELVVEYVKHVRNFDAWLDHLPVHLYGSFMPTKEGPAAHSFVYKTRSDLTMKETNQIPDSRWQRWQRYGRNEEDVFAIVKGRMHLTESHPPRVVLPKSAIPAGFSSVPQQILPLHPVEKPGDLEKLIEFLKVWIPRSVQSVQDVLHPPALGPAPELSFLRSNPPRREKVAHTTNMFYEHLPDNSRQLFVKFRRA